MGKAKFLLFLAAFLFLPGAMAVGLLLPPSNNIYFEPNKEAIVPFGVSNNAATDMNITIGIGGDLAKYARVSDDYFFMRPNEVREFTVKFNFPERIDIPGEHIIRVIASEQPKSGQMFSVMSTISDRIIVHVPYPGIYINWDFIAENANVDETADLRIIVTNLGKDDVKNARATVDIFGPSEEGFGNKVKTISTESSRVLSGTTTTFHAYLNTSELKQGEYKATATLFYDEAKEEIDRFFKIGSLYVKLINYTKKFRKDTIEKININVESRWNNRIDDAYVIISIKDKEDKAKLISELKTPNFNLNAWENKNISTYWDTHGFETGKYDATIIIYYRDAKTAEDVILEIFEEEKKSPFFNMTVLLVIVIAILIIGDIILIAKRRKGREKGKKPKSRK